MSDFMSQHDTNGFLMKLWRGERMCLVGFDVVAAEADLVGFAIECKAPGSPQFDPLLNRLAFAYPKAATTAVTGARQFPSTGAPFQKFRWVHFPRDPKAGVYTYRGTKMHMRPDGSLAKGTAIELPISLDPVTYDDFLDVGFTRGFASSQAYAEKFGNNPNVIPSKESGLTFQKIPGEVYDWLGFEAYDLLFAFLKEAVDDPTIELDVFAYDLNEPDIVARLKALGHRLRVIVDDSGGSKAGVAQGHLAAGSDESKAFKVLKASAGAAHARRTHFQGLQHNKVFIAKRNGKPFKVLAGSTNFSFRGIYIQANNVLVFHSADVAGQFGRVFDAAFADPAAFAKDPIASKWHLAATDNHPSVQLCFSPHQSSDLSLNPVRGAIDQATSSVFYAVAFLSQIRSGPTKEAFDRLMKRPVFSYGVVDKAGTLEIKKPDGSTGLVDFAYLAKNAPEPFKSEWSGGGGINVHHKFVVTDFSLPSAKVFTGSSNLAPSGEKGNGDHLIMIEDPKIAVGYAIEALRVFDHLHFRSTMRDADKAKKKSQAKKAEGILTLRKPEAMTGKPAWFADFYKAGTQAERDRMLFSR